MISRLSNTASQREIEIYLGIPFLYENIYRPQIIINGREETSLVLVPSEFPTLIQFGIWGILPQDYSKEWQHFQNFEISLTTDIKSIHSKHWLHGALKERRCYIIVTGYFYYLLRKKNLQPWFSAKESNQAFCLAGLYNRTDDGFITFTILIKESRHFQIKNSLSPIVPIILSKKERKYWLENSNTSPETYIEFLDNTETPILNQHPVNPAIMGKGKKTMQMLEPYNK